MWGGLGVKKKEIDQIFHQLTIHLVRAKVDLEYGLGFSRNTNLLDCQKEIDRALELIPVKSK